MSIDPGRGDDAGAHSTGRTDPTAGRTGTARLGEDVGPDRWVETDPTAGVAATLREFHSEAAASIADPAPLGLSAFALTTFLLSLVNAGAIPAVVVDIVVPTALAYGGISQFLAGIWEFRRGNTFGAVAFSSYGMFWVSFWLFETFVGPGITPVTAAATALGWFLIAWGIFTFLLLIATLRTTVALVVIFVLLTATFFLLGIGNINGSTGLVTWGGWVGVATAAAAWYTALASILASTFGKAVLPNPPLNAS